jgi:hypothetical protein
MSKLDRSTLDDETKRYGRARDLQATAAERLAELQGEASQP